MRQSSYTIGAAQKDIRALAGDHFVNVNLKVTKSTVNAKLVNGVLEAGTLLTEAGGPVTSSTSASDAYGIVYADVDFNNSKGTEVVPVMIHGFVKTKMIKLNSSDDIAKKEKEALNMIKFL